MPGSDRYRKREESVSYTHLDVYKRQEYTQAAMVAACLAITGELKKRGLHPDMTAGLSLGEYCAIAAAGGMCDMDAVRTCLLYTSSR